MLVRLAIRNARRNLRRTLLTASTVVFGVAMIVLALSWINGIFEEVTDTYTSQAGHVSIVDADFAQRRELQPLYENIPDARAVMDEVLAVPGVEAAEPIVQLGVIVAVGEEIGEDFAFLTGATDTYYRERMNGESTLVDGTWLTGAEGEVVLGRKIASQTGAEVGDTASVENPEAVDGIGSAR